MQIIYGNTICQNQYCNDAHHQRQRGMPKQPSNGDAKYWQPQSMPKQHSIVMHNKLAARKNEISAQILREYKPSMGRHSKCKFRKSEIRDCVRGFEPYVDKTRVYWEKQVNSQIQPLQTNRQLVKSARRCRTYEFAWQLKNLYNCAKTCQRISRVQIWATKTENFSSSADPSKQHSSGDGW